FDAAEATGRIDAASLNNRLRASAYGLTNSHAGVYITHSVISLRRLQKMDRYKVLLKDFGYKLDGNTLIQKGIKGFMSDRILPGRFKDAMDAAVYLCPIIKDAEFTRRLS